MARTPRSSRAPAPVFDAIAVEGALIAPAMLARIAERAADGQGEPDYAIPKGLTLRDEVARYFRIGQAQFEAFDAMPKPTAGATVRFVEELLRDVFGFADINQVGSRTLDDRTWAVTLEALGGRVPIVVIPPADGLDAPSDHLPTDGRRRSASTALQDWLNANDDALWGLCSNGVQLRLMRDNASLTRPAYIEADLRTIFENEGFADFAALWLMIHRTRFGSSEQLPHECFLERWRVTGESEGVAARERLAVGFEDALLSLGQGFVAHPNNSDLRDRLVSGDLPLPEFFGQLLRLVYRLIFLFAAEDRCLLHPAGAGAAVRELYSSGYSVSRLRERAVRRSAWDLHHDLWQGLLVVFAALSRGEDRLGLPALGGLFANGSIPDLEAARLNNRDLLQAVFRLAWLRESAGLVPVNWRDMETEELGSVYEGLLELTPRLSNEGRGFSFVEKDQNRGNERKRTGSYYTPDSLVALLLDSTLDPVLDAAERRNPDDPIAEILKLTIVDPACGSGHFLLGAARRTASRIARRRAAGSPSQAEFQHALREVVAHCIYGVDRNPMAVELCKVALWIEALEPGKPLTFLDSHIRCGDSLIGVFDLEVLRLGIPDDAYKPQPGDEKEVAAYYRTKNKREIEERERVESGLGLSESREALSSGQAQLQEKPEESLEDVEAKQRLFEELTARGGVAWTLNIACNLWTAAWFSPKVEMPVRGREVVPTSGQVWEHLRGGNVYGPLIAEADRCAHQHRFFHWPIEFPDIVARGGFDVVIGNPPWERVKLQEQEFFSSRDPDIAQAKNAASRKRLIAALEDCDPALYASWNAAVRTAACESTYLRLGGRYPLGGVGDVNTYAVFADLFRQAICADGRTGLILPTGLVSGFTYRDFLGHLLRTKTLASFYGFENEDLIFRHITNKVKFGVLSLTGENIQIEQPWFTAHIRQPEQSKDPERRYALTIEEIEAINPNTLNLPAFRWAKDAEVTAAIHGAAPVLVRKPIDGEPENPWKVDFQRMFDMANDSAHFLDHADIEPLIVERREALAILEDGRQVYPLYEGKMFWHFDHRYGTYEGQTERQANKGVLPRVSNTNHADRTYRIEPRYWVEAGLTHDALGENQSNDWFFSWRDVGPSERTFVGTIIPRTASGHKSPILISSQEPKLVSALVACLSSLVVDYSARQRGSGMSFFIVEQLPVIAPSEILQFIQWLGSTAGDWLSDRVLELCYTNDELASFAADLGRDQLPFRWLPERRVLLQAEIDAAVLHFYGLSRDQAEWLLDSFTVLRKYEERDHDEFRTKKLVLEIYDEMAAARSAGSPYETRLDPSPADPRCCHPSTFEVAAK